MNSYRDKYLKYKKKYLELKTKLSQKGGEIVSRCNRISINPYSDLTQPIYLINYLYNYFSLVDTKQTKWNSLGLLVDLFLVQFQTTPALMVGNENITSVKFNYLKKVIPQPPPGDPSHISSTMQLNTSVPAALISSYTNVNIVDDRGVVKVNKHHQNIQSSLLSDIIGKNLNLRCNESNVENIILNLTDIRFNKKVVIIDFQNYVNKLNDKINSLNINDQNYKKKTMINQINAMLSRYIEGGNYVFIIFKKSRDFDYQFLYELLLKPNDLRRYCNQNSLLHVISVDIYKPSVTGAEIDIYGDSYQSSIDDYVFWLITVFLYNLISHRINTIHENGVAQPTFQFEDPINLANNNRIVREGRFILLTNDKQRLDVNFNNYYNNIVQVNMPSEPLKPQKNLFDLNILTDYSIYLSYIVGNLSQPVNNLGFYEDGFISLNDILLNEYVNFLYNLFGNTPVKLNGQIPNYKLYHFINRREYDVSIDNYRTSEFYRYSNPARPANDTLNSVFNSDTKNNKIKNTEAFVCLYEKFKSETILLSQLRTDTIRFLIHNYPVNGIRIGGRVEYECIGDIISSDRDITNIFSNLFIHPGIFFYGQIKYIQYSKYRNEDGSLDLEQMVDISDDQKNLQEIYQNYDYFKRNNFDLQQQTNVLIEQITDLQRQITSLQEQITSLQEQKVTLQIQLDECNKELSKKIQEYTTMKQSYNEAYANYQRVQRERNESRQQLTELRLRETSIQSTIASLEEEITRLTTQENFLISRINALEAEPGASVKKRARPT